MVEATEQVNAQVDQIDTPIPKYTQWDAINEAIFKIASGKDEKHPVFGLGDRMLFHEEFFDFKKNGVRIVGLRIVFPGEEDRELSYLLSLKADGSLIVRPEGWLPRLDSNEYIVPNLKPEQNLG